MVSFNIASEASYVYILSGQKSKNAVNGLFCGQTALPILIGQNFAVNAKIEKFKWDILSNFQTMCELALKDQKWSVKQCCQEGQF